MLKNTFLKKLIAYSFYLLLGTILMLIRKCSSKKRKINKNYNNENDIIYISYPQKAINAKKLIISILLIILYYFLTLLLDIFFQLLMELVNMVLMNIIVLLIYFIYICFIKLAIK